MRTLRCAAFHSGRNCSRLAAKLAAAAVADYKPKNIASQKIKKDEATFTIELEKNKDILTDAIAFTLAKSIDKAAGAMVIPQSCAAVVAGVVTTLTAQLACERTLPNGAREWGSTGASGF